MLIKHPSDILPSEITSESIYQERRHFMQTMATITSVGIASTMILPTAHAGGVTPPVHPTPPDFPHLPNSPFNTDEELTPLNKITSYANFYEFGMDKSDPETYAKMLVTRPWTIQVVGAVAKPGIIDIEDILRDMPLEERIYRMRCVEGWSMVIPWVGFPLRDLLKRFQPTSQAKFVEFITRYDPQHMPGQEIPILSWPYQEGLRFDEAMHPLTILSVGIYGRLLPNENGAPLRLVVPWKYGFKSIKSIVKIRLVEEQPSTTWQSLSPAEYGFYANVNPEVPHPHWTQSRERRIGEFFKRDTLMFNGYAEQVAALYTNLDLRINY
jgi:sulfoxide reductase catalytic subunit YedY